MTLQMRHWNRYMGYHSYRAYFYAMCRDHRLKVVDWLRNRGFDLRALTPEDFLAVTAGPAIGRAIGPAIGPSICPATCPATNAAAPVSTQDESPSGSPEQAANGHCSYQGSGLDYGGDPKAGQMALPGPREGEVAGLARSDSASDCAESYTSPESWSSVSSREGVLPQDDPATWVEKALQEEASRSTDGSEDITEDITGPLFALIEQQQFDPTEIMGSDHTDNIVSIQQPPQQAPMTVPKKPNARAANTPKGKVRSAFSEGQMTALVRRFSVQRYLTPAEMKHLAEMTGMTYKQVKTWFQNRRMKLRRHQKDTTWVSERYNVNKDRSVHGAWNIPSHIPPFQGEVHPQPMEQYNHPMMTSPPQNMAFYLPGMGGASGSAGYSPWPSTSQMGVPAAGWSTPPGDSQYQYNPNAFNSAGANIGYNVNFGDMEAMTGQGCLNPAMMPHISQ